MAGRDDRSRCAARMEKVERVKKKKKKENKKEKRNRGNVSKRDEISDYLRDTRRGRNKTEIKPL